MFALVTPRTKETGSWPKMAGKNHTQKSMWEQRALSVFTVIKLRKVGVDNETTAQMVSFRQDVVVATNGFRIIGQGFPKFITFKMENNPNSISPVPASFVSQRLN